MFRHINNKQNRVKSSKQNRYRIYEIDNEIHLNFMNCEDFNVPSLGKRAFVIQNRENND